MSDQIPAAGYSPLLTMEEVNAYLATPRIVCFECGREFKFLARHIATHGMTAREYKIKWGIPVIRGLQCEATQKLKSEISKSLGLAANGKAYWEAHKHEEKDYRKWKDRIYGPVSRASRVKASAKGGAVIQHRAQLKREAT